MVVLIFLGIIAFLILLFVVILMLPVDVILKTANDGKLIFRVKFLNKLYGENSSDREPTKKCEKADDAEKEGFGDKLKAYVATTTLSEKLAVIASILKRVFKLLGHFKVKTLRLKVVCAEGDAAKTAISYGKCHAIIWPAINLLHSKRKVNEKHEDISVVCDYSKEKGSIEFETVLSVRIFRILSAVIMVVFDELRRVRKKKRNTT